jgi:hypothetical protein
MKFLVVVPTIRQSLPGFEDTMAQLKASFTHPTEFHILDGSKSKPDALNRAYDELLTPSDCDVYVTVDDDYIAGKNWQDEIAKAMDVLPEVGAFGIWLGDKLEMLEVMGAYLIGPELKKNGLRYRELAKTHHIAGALIAFRREIAIGVGKQPESDFGYQIWEDAYRGRRVRLLGKELAYIVLPEGPPHLIVYADTKEYLEKKQREMDAGHALSAQFLAKGGIKDPWTLQLRRFLGRNKVKLLNWLRGKR